MHFNNGDIDDGVKNYFKNLKHFKTLKKEEERSLLEAYKKHNDIGARNKLIEANLKYACKLANTYRGRGLSLSELITEANDGLIEAIDRFDIERDVRLISYSKWWIIQRIQKALQEENAMNGRDVSEYNRLGENQDGDDTNYCNNSDIIDNEIDETSLVDIEELLDNVMCKLTDREREMLCSYYGINGRASKTLDEIGKDFKLTKERVRQIIEKAMLKVKSEALLLDTVFLD